MPRAGADEESAGTGRGNNLDLAVCEGHGPNVVLGTDRIDHPHPPRRVGESERIVVEDRNDGPARRLSGDARRGRAGHHTRCNHLRVPRKTSAQLVHESRAAMERARTALRDGRSQDAFEAAEEAWQRARTHRSHRHLSEGYAFLLDVMAENGPR